MKRHLPLICPSVQNDEWRLTSRPCERKACCFWGKQKGGEIGCTAGEDTAEAFTRWFRPDRDATLPECKIAVQCSWNVDALKRGEPGCTPRRLDMTCEHQGGDWNTFDMADPDDSCWGVDSEPASDVS